MTVGEQYIRLAAQFALLAAISRILTPSEIGLSVIGVGIMLVVLGLREFATADFLIKRAEIVRDEVRAAFTVQLALTCVLTLAIYWAAPWFGRFYGEDGLTQFLRIAVLAAPIEALTLPLRGLLRRELSFGPLAVINVSGVAATSVATIGFALIGFSYLSIAWGTVFGAIATSAVALALRPDLATFRPTMRCWSSVLTFGGYNGASFAINRIYETLPQLVLGHVMPHAAVAVYNRASIVSDVPDKLILNSALPVAFPAFTAHLRQDSSLKSAFLRVLALGSVVYWPAHIGLIVLAAPIVRLLLGQQWLEVVPLLQVMAIAGLAWLPVVLAAPILLAVGANRDRTAADLACRGVSAVILCSAAPFGIMAMAVSKLVTLPFQMVVALFFIRRHVPFLWHDLWLAIRKSVVVSITSALGPTLVLARFGEGTGLSLPETAVAVLLGLAGWLAGVFLTRHPVVEELGRAWTAGRAGLARSRLAGAVGA